jgi:hypothetical protein
VTFFAFIGFLLLVVVLPFVTWSLGHAAGYERGHEAGFHDGSRPVLPAGSSVFDGVEPCHRAASPVTVTF